MTSGPLCSLKVLEFAGLGPAPFCGMLLSDLGADVIRIDRRGARPSPFDRVTGRGRRSVALDLKTDGAAETCLRLAERADVLLEGFRPGVMERLGLGPEVALTRNPRLVYGRMTGWGQSGPYAKMAGHDINYIALSGALHAIGPSAKPTPPLNLLGDFGGGGSYLAFGVLAAVIHAGRTGRGQVVDCAMTDGAASLMAMIYGLWASAEWDDCRNANLLDGAAPFYDTYECSDGEWVAIGSLEPQFYAILLKLTELSETPLLAEHMNRDHWPQAKSLLRDAFRAKTRTEWCSILEGTDVCFAPVLSLAEVADHPHNVARGTFVDLDGCVQPAPAPRFSETPGEIQGSPPAIGEHNASALSDWGFSASEIGELKIASIV